MNPTPNPPALPARERRRGTGGGVILCTNKLVNLTRELSDFPLLQPGDGTVFPGALLRVNAGLLAGTPEPLLLPRAPMAMTPELGTTGPHRSRPVMPTAADTRAVLAALLGGEAARAAPPGLQGGPLHGTRSSRSFSKAYAPAQLALDLGLPEAWAGEGLQTLLQVDPSGESNVVVACFRQIVCSLVVDAPEEPEAVFAEGLTSAQQAQAGFDDGHPLAWVSRVDYGRLVFVRMRTRGSHMRMDAEAALRLATGDHSVAGCASARHERIAQASRFTVLTIGGHAEGALQRWHGVDRAQLRELIAPPAHDRRRLPAPVSYQLRWLKEKRRIALAFSARYNHQECVSYEPGYVRLVHAGDFVAHFSVDWDAPDEQGLLHPQRWDSGPTSAGWSHRLVLDGDVRNLRVQARADQAHDPRGGEIFTELQAGPIDRTYKVWGTAKERRWSFTDESEPGGRHEGRPGRAVVSPYAGHRCS